MRHERIDVEWQLNTKIARHSDDLPIGAEPSGVEKSQLHLE